MKRRFICIYIISFLTMNNFCSAQQWQWVTTGGSPTYTGTNWEPAWSVSNDIHQNVYATGGYYNTLMMGAFAVNGSINNLNFFIAKTDSSGNPLWLRSYSGAGGAWGDRILWASDNNIIITGTYNDTLFFAGDTLTTPSHSSQKVFVASIDANGNENWIKSFGNLSFWSKLALKNNGDIILAAPFQDSVAIGTNTWYSQYAWASFLVELDLSGNIINSKMFADNGGVSGITCDQSGNFFFQCAFWTSSDTVFISTDTFFVRTSPGQPAEIIGSLDANYSFNWGIKIENSSAGGSNTLAHSQGNLYKASEFYNSTVVGADTLFSSVPYNEYVACIDASNGSFKWVKQLVSGFTNFCEELAAPGNGKCYAACSYTGLINFDTIPIADDGSGYNQILILKIDSTGILENYFTAAGNNVSDNSPTSICVGAHERITVGGGISGTCNFGNISVQSAGTYDVFVAQISDISTGISNPDLLHNALLFPNPNEGEFFLSDNGNSAIEIQNTLGQKISFNRQNYSAGLSKITLTDFAPGIYLLTKKYPLSKIESVKFITNK